MRNWWKEPLLHFLALGLLMFVGFGLVNRGGGNNGKRIVVDDAVVADILQRYVAVWQRPPTLEEMKGLIDSYVREEVLYREGVAMGLDQDDQVVRRRVRQKLDVIAEEAKGSATPTNVDLEAYLQAHLDRYAIPALYSLQQVFFDPGNHGGDLDGALSTARDALRGGADPATLGDVTLLASGMTDASTTRIERDFGKDFAAAVPSLPVGEWQGPVSSAFGVHLVRVTARTAGRTPTLDDVRLAVERDWENDRRLASADAYYAKLLANYDVVIKAAIPEVAEDLAK